jgi:transcriptional regulator
MYIPSVFEITDRENLKSFLQENAFGNFLFVDSDEICSVHLPFLLKETAESFFLEGHLAIQNPFSKSIFENKKGKCMVLGAHGYVSSSVYSHINVPTYNYQVAEISGVFTQLNQEEFDTHLSEVVNSFESNRVNKVQMSDWPKEMIQAYKSEIIGFRFEISDFKCAFKLSQNRNEADFQSIINDLEKGSLNQQIVAREMKKIKR